jgi:Holliday junction DNA helicase RuvB
MGESVETLEQAVEPFLLAQGFVEKTARGRIATAKARSTCGAAA